MTADATNLLAEIRRSGGDVRLVGCDRLKLVAPKALLPALTDRVRAAKPMLLAALADTASQVSAAQEGGGGVSNPRHNGATAQHLVAESTSDRADPTPAVKWRARNREALAYWSLSPRRRSSAARLGRNRKSLAHAVWRARAALAVRRLPRTDRRGPGASPRG